MTRIGPLDGAKPLGARVLRSRNLLDTCRKHRNVEPSKMCVFRSHDTYPTRDGVGRWRSFSVPKAGTVPRPK